MRRVCLIAVVTLLAVLCLLPCYAETIPETAYETGDTAETVDAAALEEEAQDAVRRGLDAILRYTPEEWREIIEARVVPWVTLAVSAVVGIYVAISPILSRIKKTSAAFEKTGERLDEANKKTTNAKDEAAAARAELKAFQEEQNKKYDELVAAFSQVSSGYQNLSLGLTNIERIVRIAFCNTEELVQKGFAREIEKVGAGNEGLRKEQKPEESQG